MRNDLLWITDVARTAEAVFKTASFDHSATSLECASDQATDLRGRREAKGEMASKKIMRSSGFLPEHPHVKLESHRSIEPDAGEVRMSGVEQDVPFAPDRRRRHQ